MCSSSRFAKRWSTSLASARSSRRCKPLAEVGLDYLKLGQPVPTLSGGEAQRLKLAGHLAESQLTTSAAATNEAQGVGLPMRPNVTKLHPAGTLFIFDEPTTGLHFDDIEKLLRAFDRLIDAGNSLLVIEHNLDVIGAADWLVDLGPEGGEGGGEVVCVGTPDEVMRHATSHTGKALREYREAAECWIDARACVSRVVAFSSQRRDRESCPRFRFTVRASTI